MKILAFLWLATRICAGVVLLPREIANICRSPPANNCEFYAICLEARYQCGPQGYPLGFGERYCQAFAAARPRMSAAGQEWATKTMLCLQKALVPIASQASPTTCEKIKQVAYASHPGCYIQSGYCTLARSDLAIISDTVEPKDVIGSPEARQATLDTIAGCGQLYRGYLWQEFLKLLRKYF